MALFVNVIQTITVKMEVIDDIVDFKPNSALSAGTNVFLSGYWRKGQVISIDIDGSKGKIYTLFKTEIRKAHELSKYLFRPNML
jgi:hypothetical protein